jgi:probable HAF family extracellular repeat protein
MATEPRARVTVRARVHRLATCASAAFAAVTLVAACSGDGGADGAPRPGETMTDLAAGADGAPRAGDWTITDLGAGFEAYAINDHGEIAGTNGNPAVWRDGRVVVLSGNDWDDGVATSINDRGDVAGWFFGSTSSEVAAFLWQNGAVTAIELDVMNQAAGVDVAGAVVGTSAGGWDDLAADVAGSGEYDEFAAWVDRHAWRWQHGKATPLRSSEGSLRIPRAIGDAGHVVGENGRGHAALWYDGELVDLGTLPGHASSAATAVNRRGWVVGVSFESLSGAADAFLWRDGTMTKVTPGLGLSSRAYGINDRGQVVGSSDARSAWPHAFVWEDGRYTDLGTLPGHRESGAVAINDSGQIVGWSRENPLAREHAVLWARRADG